MVGKLDTTGKRCKRCGGSQVDGWARQADRVDLPPKVFLRGVVAAVLAAVLLLVLIRALVPPEYVGFGIPFAALAALGIMLALARQYWTVEIQVRYQCRQCGYIWHRVQR